MALPGPTKAARASESDARPLARSSTPLVIQSTTEQLFLEVKMETEENGRISDDLLSALSFVFQHALLPAFELLDQRAVCHYSCPSGRELYRVRGSGGRMYSCFTSSNYCSCPSFVYTVLVREDALLCKHALAVQLARALTAGRRGLERRRAEESGGHGEEEGVRSKEGSVVEEVYVTDEELGELLVSAIIQEDEQHQESVHQH